MKKDRELYKEKLKEYTAFYSTLDASKLKPASGILREYQLKTLDFCKKIIFELEKQNIKYFPIGGTLIGAIRHGGFVPWDDDFDIGMMRKDYTKTLEFCKKNFIEISTSEIAYTTKNRFLVWNKYLKKNPNKIIFSKTPHHIQILKGTSIDDCVNIDIFPHDNYKNSLTLDEYNKYMAHIATKKYSLGRFDKILEFYENERKTNPIFDENGSVIYYGLDNIDNYILTRKGFFNYDMIFPLKKIKFEDFEISIQNDPLQYAELQYRNCLKMPSDITISSHINARKNDTLFFKAAPFRILLFYFLRKLISKNQNEENIDIKQAAIIDLKEKLFYKKENFKTLYYNLSSKYEFLKSISE